ncbi:GNAT family N-acetyltransferase [Actinomycetospora sp. NBRC 106378]|uniref:GNAT family N-acetyltransferase n=1 Tax=Actinomycetospora sp. NBRC 106378 TaxID=3032208 RepID=UPI0024A5909E|nr:GNAT family N-acetyltransferase [Actinomycetospora sp. NBRC 106378]GLZ52114.1 GNAT family N-acetyltransferase [Actinomycetospora sp. NBRC 106378]
MPRHAARTAPDSPATVLAELLEVQRRRFAALDARLPEAVAPPPGDIVVVGTPPHRVAGVVTHHTWPAGSGPLLWSAAQVSELHPVVGAAGHAPLHALVEAWRGRLLSAVLREPDSAATVTWPSRDVVATRVFLDHGLVPLAVLAVRPPGPLPAPPPDPAVDVRRATPDDLDACVRLALEELAYSSQVGGSIVRADAEAVKRTAIRDRLTRGEPTWIALRGDRAVGMMECGRTESAPGTWLAGLLPHGAWGYVNCASVTSAERGSGVGHRLAAAALPELEATESGLPGRGTYLYYNPPNPLSSVFWPRVGYRPLWTLWEVRPAGGLRSA